jgi:hypothetical protein
MSTRTDLSSTGDAYTVRRYRPADRADVLSLYEQVFGADGERWFSWKYESNPFVDHVPMTVATYEGRVVATKPCTAMRLRVGDDVVLGLQPSDVMVHPDHRRNGLYSRTTEYLKEVYADREPALFFNFPNRKTLSGSLKHGWRVVEAVETAYRVQRPEAVTSGRADALARAIGPAVRALYRRRDRRRDVPPDVTVVYDDLSPASLASLYRSAIPDGFHAHRDRSYFEWRYDNPDWNYGTYVAERDGVPAAAVVAATRETPDGTELSVTDTLPLRSEGRERLFAAILDRLISDHRDAAILTAGGGALSPALLSRFGFLQDSQFPLSRLARPSTLVTYPTGGEDWTVAGRDLTDPDEWALTLSERDTR